MVGYLYLSFALFAGITKGFCGKKISGAMQTFRDCLFINVVRMLFCALIGFAFVLIEWKLSDLQLNAASIGVYLLAAFGMTTFCVCWMYAYKQDAYVFLNIFTMLSSIITCFLSSIFYKDAIEWNEWVGMAILLCAVAIMSKYNRELKGKLSIRAWIILIVGCLGSSVADFSQKIYMKSVGDSVATFNFYMYAFGFALLMILYALVRMQKREQKLTQELVDTKYVFAYFAMSLFLFLNSSFKTLAIGILPPTQIYPILQGANLILSGIMAHTLFKEKLNLKSILGMVCAFIGLLTMTML